MFAECVELFSLSKKFEKSQNIFCLEELLLGIYTIYVLFVIEAIYMY